MKVSCKPLSEILTYLKVMSADSVTVIPSNNGWEFYARDLTNCAMVSAVLKPEAFPEGYELWDPFAADPEFLRDNIAKRDSVDITLDDGFMKIVYEKSKCKRRLINLDETPRVLPRIKLADSVAILSDKLLEAAANKYMAANGSATGLEVKIGEQELTFSYETELDAYTESYDVLMANLPEGEQISHFSPQLLVPVLKNLPKGVPVVIEMDCDKPIKLALQTETSSINLFVAPLIGED